MPGRHAWSWLEEVNSLHGSDNRIKPLETPLLRRDQQANDRTQPVAPEHSAFQVRLPGFVTDEQIGLGDVVTRATYAVGIRPCGGCQARAATLNGWVAFVGRRP
jgi:hypothetical protein